ncbi:GlxA family transcriptional regulator [Streptomyces sp. NPDC004457]
MPISVALLFPSIVAGLDISAAREVFGVDRSDLVDPWYEFAGWAPDDARNCDACRVERLWSTDQLPTAHTIVVPAWPDVHEEPPAALVRALRTAHGAGSRVVAASTGVFVLAAAGLLDGRRASVHWAHADALTARYPQVRPDPAARYLDDGDLLTSVGGAASLELFLHVVSLDHGSAVAKALARRLFAPFADPGTDAPAVVEHDTDEVLAQILPWVSERLEHELTVDDMAEQARVSRRTLTRHFRSHTGMAPLQWVLSQRVHRAQRLLETTAMSVEQIATQCGMGTGATLRRHFNRTTGLSPDAYRRWFRAKGAGSPPSRA